MPLSYKEIAEIIKIIDASECEELVVEVDGARLEVRRHATNGQTRAPHSGRETRSEERPVAVDTVPAGPGAGGVAEESGAPQEARGSATLGEGTVAIRAPMVGTFFRAPDPQAPPFVEVGDSVKPGDSLCLIEVMKLYTTIKAEMAGRIVEIVVDSGTLVEHDQVLFVIEPA